MEARMSNAGPKIIGPDQPWFEVRSEVTLAISEEFCGRSSNPIDG